MRTLTVCVLVCLLAPSARAQQTQADFEKLAQALPYLAPQEFLLRGRTFTAPDDLGLFPRVPTAARKQYSATLNELVTGKYATADVVKLLHHADPKVRTLAILRLVDAGGPKQLPLIATLVDDQAKAFGELHQSLRGSFTFSDEEPPDVLPKLEPLTVGYVARLALSAYMDQAEPPSTVRDYAPQQRDWENGGGENGVIVVHGLTEYLWPRAVEADPVKLRARFDAYWATRKDRTHCVSWYELRFLRATQGVIGPQDDRKPFVQQLRRDIDKLPEPERTYAYLHLMGNGHDSGLIEREELVKMCRALGDDKLLAVLAGEQLTDDPDLRITERTPHAYWPMIRYLLQSSRDVFTPAASDKILALEQAPFGQKNRSAWWSIAAAELQPKRAADIITPALQGKFDSEGGSHALLAHALWRLADTPPHDVLRDWFYGQGALRPEHQATFLHEAEQERPKRVRQLLGELVRDNRFDTTDWPTVEYVAKAVNRWSAQDIIGKAELSSLTHPYGRHGFITNVKELRERHPDETDAVVKTLADWRRRLRKSVPLWMEGK